jgi:hypothetical protein
MQGTGEDAEKLLNIYRQKILIGKFAIGDVWNAP